MKQKTITVCCVYAESGKSPDKLLEDSFRAYLISRLGTRADVKV